jgi:hypothetical protein
MHVYAQTNSPAIVHPDMAIACHVHLRRDFPRVSPGGEQPVVAGRVHRRTRRLGTVVM